MGRRGFLSPRETLQPVRSGDGDPVKHAGRVLIMRHDARHEHGRAIEPIQLSHAATIHPGRLFSAAIKKTSPERA
jgi:hypothetical protein